MTKTISKIGNSQGIIFDAALINLARPKSGDQLTVTVHEGGSIVLTPSAPPRQGRRDREAIDP